MTDEVIADRVTSAPEIGATAPPGPASRPPGLIRPYSGDPNATPKLWVETAEEMLRELADGLRAGRRLLKAEDALAVASLREAADVLSGQRETRRIRPWALVAGGEERARQVSVALEAGMAAHDLLDRGSLEDRDVPAVAAALSALHALVRAGDTEGFPS